MISQVSFSEQIFSGFITFPWQLTLCGICTFGELHMHSVGYKAPKCVLLTIAIRSCFVYSMPGTAIFRMMFH